MNISIFPSVMRGFALAGIALAVSSQAHAQYIPDFNTFSGNNSLSGQKQSDPVELQWQTTDANAANYVGVIPGYSTSGSDYWAGIGGLFNAAPSATTVDLWRTFALPDGGNAGVFQTKFAITSPQSPRTNQDSFSWKFRTAAGADIASVDFVPLNGTTLKLNWSNNSTQTTTAFGISYDSIYTISAVVSGLGTDPKLFVSITDSLGNTTTTVNNVALAPVTPTGIGQVAASWKLADTTANYGSNTMVFQNYSVVPEPGAILLLGFAGGAFAVSRLRRK
jgi:hypothetical protein